MDQAYKKVVYDGHELYVPAHLANKPNRIMRALLSVDDWLAQHEHLCLIALGILICVAGAF